MEIELGWSSCFTSNFRTPEEQYKAARARYMRLIDCDDHDSAWVGTALQWLAWGPKRLLRYTVTARLRELVRKHRPRRAYPQPPHSARQECD